MIAREERRLTALKAYGLLDTHSEQEYDDITRIAAAICDTPISLVSLVDERRQWFKSRFGIEATETPREWAFCSHAIRQSDVFIVEDAHEDCRFVDNPLVTGEPRIRFYAGAPLIDADGQALGTLCVIDRKPRSLQLSQIDSLAALSRQVLSQFSLRQTMARLASALDEVKTLTALLPVCAWCRDVRDDEGYWSTIEHYLVKEQGIDISHGVCPKCFDAKVAELKAARR